MCTAWTGLLEHYTDSDKMSRVAHQDVVARPVGLVSCRRSSHPPRTFASLTAHSNPLSLTHCSGTAPSCSLDVLFSWLLVHSASSISSTLDGEPQQDEGKPELAPVMPSLPTVAYKVWPATLVLSVFASYLSIWSLLFRLSSRSTPSAFSLRC